MIIFPIGDENPTGRKPYVNYALIVINVLVFALFFFRQDYNQIVMEYGFIPARPTPVTYITSLFLHGGIGHIVGNMLYLYIVGDNVEDKLGHVGYLLFYLVCGAAADYANGAMCSEKMMNIPTIGASGAISAVLGAYIFLYPKNKIIFFYFFWIFFIIKYDTFKLQSFWAIGMWFILQFFSHLTSGSMTNIAYGAHIGGFIGGGLIAASLMLLGVVRAHWDKERDYLDVERETMGASYHYEETGGYRQEMKPYIPPGIDPVKYHRQDLRRNGEDDQTYSG